MFKPIPQKDFKKIAHGKYKDSNYQIQNTQEGKNFNFLA